jgi:hypothetical protein
MLRFTESIPFSLGQTVALLPLLEIVEELVGMWLLAGARDRWTVLIVTTN